MLRRIRCHQRSTDRALRCMSFEADKEVREWRRVVYVINRSVIESIVLPKEQKTFWLQPQKDFRANRCLLPMWHCSLEQRLCSFYRHRLHSPPELSSFLNHSNSTIFREEYRHSRGQDFPSTMQCTNPSYRKHCNAKINHQKSCPAL